MQKIIILIITLLGAGFFCQVHAQASRTNISLQAGYQAKYFHPAPLNYALEQFNNFRSGTGTAFSDVSWSSGPSAGIALHNGRTSIRINAMFYGSNKFGVGTDSTGTSLRADVSISGMVFTMVYTGELIPLGRDSYFCVGAGFNFTQLRVDASSVEEAAYNPDDPLDEILNTWKPGLFLHAPFRFRITPQLKLSIEPNYQVFFGNETFATLHEKISAKFGQPQEPFRLGGPIDHVGINATLMVYLRRR